MHKLYDPAHMVVEASNGRANERQEPDKPLKYENE